MIEIAVTTKHRTYKYVLAPSLCTVHIYNGREVLFKVPQPFAVAWHIFRRRGIFKDRKISISKR